MIYAGINIRLTQVTKIPYSVFCDSEEEKEFLQKQLHHIKYKTGDNFSVIMRKALMFYNIEIDNKRGDV